MNVDQTITPCLFEQSAVTPPRPEVGLASREGTTHFRCPCNRGFTLLEILLVVVLIAITSTMILPNFQRNIDYVTKKEAERLQALISLARDEATFRATLYALQVDTVKREYRFLQHVSGKKSWRPIVAVDVLKKRQLPREVKIELQSENSSATENGATLLIHPTGEMDYFSILLRGERKSYMLSMDQNQVLTFVENTIAQ